MNKRDVHDALLLMSFRQLCGLFLISKRFTIEDDLPVTIIFTLLKINRAILAGTPEGLFVTMAMISKFIHKAIATIFN